MQESERKRQTTTRYTGNESARNKQIHYVNEDESRVLKYAMNIWVKFSSGITAQSDS